MGIEDEDVARVRRESDIVAVVTQHTQLRKVGRRFSGLCPFHTEKSPSFSVNAEDGLYYCFGCGAKGDIITFVREIEHLDFVGAVEWLAAKSGVTLRYTDTRQDERRKRRGHLVGLVEKAVDFYHRRLLEGPDAGPARGYLRSRGFDRELVERYRLGWAPDAWDELARHLEASAADLEGCGLGFVNKRGRQQDFFRGRVLFPIFDDQGAPVSFGGRILPGGDGPKYQNTRETELYEKSRVLYGLNWAKASIVQENQVVLCEGYTDVIGFGTAGLDRSVATCGTSLTEEHVRGLKRYASRLVLAFDADAAGQAAADRVYAWEQSYEIDVSVAALPPGVDPAELARTDPEALHKAVDDARPFLAFRVERVLDAADLTTAEGRARAAGVAMALVREHPNPLVRDQYVMEVADRCRIEPERLRAQLAGDGGHQPRRPQREVRRAPVDTLEGPEVEALRQAVHDPEAVAPYLDEVLFEHPVTRSAFLALASADTVQEAVERADPDAAALLARVDMEDTGAEPLDSVSQLLAAGLRRELAELEADARRSADPASVALLLSDVKNEAERLRNDPRPEDCERLVAWLVVRSEERHV